MAEAVHVLLKNGKVKGHMTCKQIAEFFGFSVSKANTLVHSGEEFLDGYTIENNYKSKKAQTAIPATLLREWDRVRLQVNPNAKRGVTTW